ncbi:MAG: hypothetical protein H8E41_10930 [Desulfobulbaceae bacterium]|uniref:Uncharacterized protein n=1 Tax=Candidatus Desulfobia pelagia TaxID=2841692 RepID=A0A8J6TCS6_9BACT|nr:hypothetical protein [Candidatus Desulfobia pelagia]
MEKIIEELHNVVRLKGTTEPGDIVVILSENPQSLIYARVACFERDTNKLDEWWHVTMYLLNVPPQKVVWALRTPQFTGEEIFTMGGKKHYIKALDFGDPVEDPQAKGAEKKKGAKPALRVVK